MSVTIIRPCQECGQPLGVNNIRWCQACRARLDADIEELGQEIKSDYIAELGQVRGAQAYAQWERACERDEQAYAQKEAAARIVRPGPSSGAWARSFDMNGDSKELWELW
jgi:hypothetical protein